MLSGQLHSLNGLSPIKAPTVPNEQEVRFAPYPDAMRKARTSFASRELKKNPQIYNLVATLTILTSTLKRRPFQRARTQQQLKILKEIG
jgi:hypothetical protein